MSRTPAPAAKTDAAPPRRVSHRHDATERQADRAADIVARGGSVTGWSFASVPAEASVHRDEDEPKKPPEPPVKLQDKPKTESESYAEGVGKVAEGILKTKAGRQVQEKITGSKPLTAAIGVGMLAAGKEVPIRLGGGFTLGVKIGGLAEGKLNSAGVTLTFGGGDKKATTAKPVIDRDSARLMESIRAQTDPQPAQPLRIRGPYVPGSVRKLPPPPETPPAPAEPVKKEDEVKRAPATASDGSRAQEFDTSGVDAATRGGGRALDPGLRHSMEARFGYDFSSVRLHDDPQAASAAAGVDAAAFTVGEHIVFGSGRFDPSSPGGRHLIAHELAHVVQQRGGAAPRTTGAPARVQRRSFWEKLAVFFGAEGSWSDAELRAYLAAITKARRFDGSYDADNKARAIVRKWKAGSPGWKLTGVQMGLLIDEMIDGPTGDADEDAILDLLERSEADDLRAIFTHPAKRYQELKSDLHWSQETRLDTFVAKRFRGGAKALARGELAVTGPPSPRGTRSFSLNAAYVEARINGRTGTDAIIRLIDRATPRDRAEVLQHLVTSVWPRTVDELGSIVQSLLLAKGERKKELKKRRRAVDKRRLKIEALLAHLLLTEVPATEAALRASTTPLAPARAAEARQVLLPKSHRALPEEAAVIDAEKKAAAADAAKKAKKKAEAILGPPKAAGGNTSPARDTRREQLEARLREQEEELARFGPASEYRRELLAELERVVLDYYEAYTTQGTRVPSTRLEPMAKPAKDETDAVFGAFYDRDAPEKKAMTFDRPGRPGNLHSWYETRDRQLRRMNPSGLTTSARQRLYRWVNTDEDLRALTARFGADPVFDEETNAPENEAAKTVKFVVEELTKAGPSAAGLDTPTTLVDKINAIYRLWGGVRRGDKIYLDLYESGGPDDVRLARWGMFQTFIHEYLHLLRHDDYTKYADRLGARWRLTLIEGVDEVFTQMVWDRVAPKTSTRKLRDVVEGAEHAALPALSVPRPEHYEEFDEAMRLVSLVGLRAVIAAYFLGEVDRIGGPARAAP